MVVSIFLHSVFRDLVAAGPKGEVELLLPAGSTVADALARLGINRKGISAVVVVNGKPVSDTTTCLSDGDQVHLFSPVSGG